MRKRNKLPIGTIIGVLIAGIFIGVGSFFFRYLRGIWPAFGTPPADIAALIEQTTSTTPSQSGVAGENNTGFPLRLSPGFSISLLAKNVPGVRVIKKDSFGNFWISQPDLGAISLIEISDGKASAPHPVLRNLRKPHGLAFDPDYPAMLYYAEEHRISRITVYSDGEPEKIVDLPRGDRHTTRTLGFGPDARLYVSIGSTCDVCIELDKRHASIQFLRRDGTDMRPFATGLRNAVFFAWHPTTHELWATEMGRDFLGDTTPPDEINIVREGKFYGWPNCYGKNVHDTAFDKSIYKRNPCMEPHEVPSYIDILAHSAPLGLAFVPADSAWPKEYWNNLLVAYHGSWNKNDPTGYKIVRYKLDAGGKYLGEEDFITGWLADGSALGRPVDLLADSDGTLYVTDDKAGVIYRVNSGSNR